MADAYVHVSPWKRKPPVGSPMRLILNANTNDCQLHQSRDTFISP
jgi:hypothetical protein